MPWTPKDAYRHTKKASTPETQHKWASIANAHLQSGGDDASAIRIANAAVGEHAEKAKRNPRKRTKGY